MLTPPARAMTPEQRREYRDKLMEILPPVPAFEAWVKKTDALPPDFDALPKVNGLPDPFLFFDGKRTVKTVDDWNQRRAEIKQLFEKYMIGTLPPKPKLDQIIPIAPEVAVAEAAARGARFGRRGGATTNARGPASAPAGRGRGGRGATAAEGSTRKFVDLKYGPGSQITTRVELTIPPGNGPFPVLIGGGVEVTRRGYIACNYPSSVDPPFGGPAEPPLNLGKYYPDNDFGSMAQAAWTAQMVVDYLYTLDEVDKPHIAITGYSRGGKMTTLAAALDERITASIAGSTGVGGVLPWRLASENNVAESIESTTRMFPVWYPSWFRFYSGREDRLPVDCNLLVDLIAPRSVLMLYGMNDEVSNTWGNEQTYYDTLKVYKFLGHPERVSILRPQGHHGANDQEAAMNWLDIQFGRSKETWKNNFLFPWDYQKWKDSSKETVDLTKFPDRHAGLSEITSRDAWEKKADEIRKSVQWMLGEAPPMSARANERVSNPGDAGIDDTPRWVIGRSIIEHGWTRQQADGIATRDIRFGNGGIRGDLYYKGNTPPNTKLPTVIFLHGNSYPLGYMWVYRTDPHPIIALANAGYAVLAFDQTGFGSRMNEAATFYERNPHWSQLGRMVEDARAAVETAQKDPSVDPDKIYLFGYGLGGTVALHAASLEPKVKGIVSICGFTPMRTDTIDKGTGGIARYFEERGLLPRLGFFTGQESRIPYDYQELIATIAPRPVYVFSPQYNRDATPADVRDAVDQARHVYGLYNAAIKLTLDEPWDYFRLSGTAQDRIVEWMKANMQ